MAAPYAGGPPEGAGTGSGGGGEGTGPGGPTEGAGSSPVSRGAGSGPGAARRLADGAAQLTLHALPFGLELAPDQLLLVRLILLWCGTGSKQGT